MKRILLIEDDTNFRFGLKELLAQKGYHIEEAGDGEIGLEKYRAHPADLVITDIMLPKKGGLETILELKKETPHVKIIAMSAQRNTFGVDSLESATVFGANHILYKPFDLDVFLDMVQSLLAPSNNA